MKNDSLKNIIIITLFFVFYIYFINAIDMFTSISDIKDDKYYIIENDQIPSIYNIIGKRKLYKYKSYTKDEIDTKEYSYKNIDNLKSDLSKYTQELRDNYNFVYTSDIDFTEDNGEISLSTNSVDNGEIIIMKIIYKNNKFEINISKGKGTIKVYE